VQAEGPAATCLGGFSAGQLMHRDLWGAVRGYDESLDRPWGWSDNDLMLRVTQERSWVDISAHGFVGLHMEHWPSSEARYSRHPSTINPMTIRDHARANDDRWGLGDATVPAVIARSACEPESGAGSAVALSRRTAAALPSDWQPSADARQFAAALGVDAEPRLADRIAAVADIVLTDRPLNAYFFGLNPPVLTAVLRSCPAAETFFIHPWPEGATDHLGFHPGTFSGFLETRCAFRGWSRIVQGPPLTALERIAASTPGTGAIEFAWTETAVQDDILRQLDVRLAPGGVTLMPTGADAAAARRRVAAAMPNCIVQTLGTTGVLAATRIR
jgi:hypothetical protein